MNLKELVTVLGHELRTPLAAIMGYQELLIDGVYGPLDPRTNEPLERIQSSAVQLLNLIDGLQELAAPSAVDEDEVLTSSTDELVARLVEAARPFADSRSVKLDTTGCPRQELPAVRMQRLLRAAELATIAAVKSSNGRTLLVHCNVGPDTVEIRIERTALHAENDSPAGVFGMPANGVPLTPARLRLAMAEAALVAVGGSLELQPDGDGTAVQLHLPLSR
jgi:signal transduction histidine kinase